ncbi:tetratricopeptide repeat protein [Cognatilysobacter terrigena]|uniref:tetratricopeptide repeat protein n=1 Tax=Cognatilysobacter terrigena TaxID=2488749 RepID=UPI001060B2A0|nr:tetratricopeptide repeat protein [Lysobacter terrigena]
MRSTVRAPAANRRLDEKGRESGPSFLRMASTRVIAAVLAVVLATVIIAAYWPGLHGPFLFDDYANLPALGAFGPVDNFRTFAYYLTSGRADPTGRPLALLSFLIDARDWPADPASFKRTNLALHVAVALLLFDTGRRVLMQLGRDATQATLCSAVGAALWAVHPMLVSTTLYVVQREAILASLFTVLGLWTTVSLWPSIQAGEPRARWTFAASITLATLLATLCKANGALLPLLASVLMGTVLWTPAPLPRASQRVVGLVIGVPSVSLLLVLAGLGIRGIGLGLIPQRNWSVIDRLMTEPRILATYLRDLLLPRTDTTGLFNDATVPSYSLIEPASTLPAIALVGALLTIGWRFRKTQPLVALAILFFFSAHLLESTVIPLELAFEHRNYAASLFLFLPAADWLIGGGRRALASRRWRHATYFVAGVLPLLLAGLTWTRASVWGDESRQALAWAANVPLSARAQTFAARHEIDAGAPAVAAGRARLALARTPAEPQLALALLDAGCIQGGVGPSDLELAETALRTSHVLTSQIYNWVSFHVAQSAENGCRGLDRASLSRLVEALGENPAGHTIPGRLQDVAQLRGELAITTGDRAHAEYWFQRAYDADPRPAVALQQSALLAQHGLPCEALHVLRHAHDRLVMRPKIELSMQGLHAYLLWRDGYWKREALRLDTIVRHEADDQCHA